MRDVREVSAALGDSEGMAAAAPLGFVDTRHGNSALALRYLAGADGIALLFHDAAGGAATMCLVAAVAAALRAQTAGGGTLQVYESPMPEHPAESFAYAWAGLQPEAGGRVTVAGLHVVDRLTVARACGVGADELARTERLVAALYRPRGCAFSGVRVISVDACDAASRSAA
ncbi:MAG: hypothetical protein ACYDAC_09845 [Candidatus Dormibacteria bacterium]